MLKQENMHAHNFYQYRLYIELNCQDIYNLRLFGDIQKVQFLHFIVSQHLRTYILLNEVFQMLPLINGQEVSSYVFLVWVFNHKSQFNIM